MPHPHPLLASKIQGFVCRSFLPKIRVPRNPRPAWLARSVASYSGPSRTKKSKSKKNSHDQHKEENEPVVRVFDQFPDGVRTEVDHEPQNAAEEALLESMQSTIRDMKKKMSENGETEEIDEGELEDRIIGRHMADTFTDEAFEDYMVSQFESRMDELEAEVDKRMENLDVQNLSQEERSELRKEVYQSVKDTAAFQPISKTSTSELLSPSPAEPGFLIPVSKFPDLQGQISVLNSLLRQAAKNLDAGHTSKMARDTWKAYHNCRIALLSQPTLVPNEAWELLWAVFADSENTQNRFLKALGEDMINAGLPLRGWQRLFYIQANFARGRQHATAAIEEWERINTEMGDNPDSLKGYWELGVSMYSQTHQLGKALKAAKPLVETSTDPTDFRIFIPIIKAFLSSNEKEKGQKAWALYIRLRIGLGPQMEMKDYDAIVSMFFEAYFPDLALGVFRDMMLTGDASAGRHDSMMRYGNGPGVKSDLDLMKVGEQELTWDDPRVLANLPAKFSNKFFYGKWLKKLIAEGQFDASISVFNLMHERGIRTDPRYLNGLIGAWLRSGLARNHKLAEDTAWRMIQERLDFAEKRDTAAKLSLPLRDVGWHDKSNYKSLLKYPKATIETFAVLIKDYRRRQRHDRMKDLFAALKQAKIQPNTFFMNQMIMVDSEIQQYWAWDMYSSFTRNYGVRPDSETFVFLWYLVKQSVDPIYRNQKRKLARGIQNSAIPRIMFAEMTKWAPKLNQTKKLPKELYDMIILCFSLAQDQAGTAVALRALQRHFNMYPNENTVRTIVLQLARAGLSNELGRTPRRLNLNRSPVVKERVVQVTRLLEDFKKQRVDALLGKGIVFEELQGDAKLEESLILMSQLLRHVTQIRLEKGQSATQLSKAAAEDMGVPDCAPWVG